MRLYLAGEGFDNGLIDSSDSIRAQSTRRMLKLDDHPSGRHFLQIPGPTNVPDRVLRALDHPTIDHRGPEFARLTLEILDGLKRVFQTSSPIVIYPASGTGAWEAALVNTLSPGDRVLMFETGHFATLWRKMADKLGLSSTSFPAIGAAAPTPRSSNLGSGPTRARASRRCWSCITKRRPASPPRSRRFARRSTAPVILRC
jgi:hypothetical protein